MHSDGSNGGTEGMDPVFKSAQSLINAIKKRKTNSEGVFHIKKLLVKKGKN